MTDETQPVARQMAERRKSQLVRPPDPLFSIFHNANAVKLSWRSSSHDNGEVVIAWKDTIRIEVFKQDLFAVDLICLTIDSTHDKQLELNEDMDGWESLVEKLPDYLPGCETLAEWFPAVAFPPYKTNRKIIYSRAE